MSANVAVAYLEEQGERAEEWDGVCMELVDALLHLHPEGDILWVDLYDHPTWRYHASLVLDGVVHDAWYPELRPVERFVREVFGECASWELNPGSELGETLGALVGVLAACREPAREVAPAPEALDLDKAGAA